MQGNRVVGVEGVLMTKTMAMLDTDPSQPLLDKQLLARCIDTCLECEQACTACADADLGEQMVADLVKCARLNLDCADMCQTTARVLSRQTRSEEHTSELQSRRDLVCRLLLEKKK